MVFYIDPPDGGKRKPAPRDAELERLQKLENATFVTTGLGGFSRSLGDEFANRVSAGETRGGAFSEDMKHFGLGLIDDMLAGIETLPNGRPRIDEVGRGRFRERARAMLTLKLDEGKKLQARQAERDALGALSAVGRELNEVAERRPNDFAAIRDNLSRAVDEFTGVFGAEREASIRRELDDDLFFSRLKGMAASDLDAALAELDDPANLPGQDEDEREELRARLRMMAAASHETPELAALERGADERREDAAATAQLDATLSAAEHVGTPAALKEARAALDAAVTHGGLAQTRFDAVLTRLEDREAALLARDGRIERIEALLAEGKRPDSENPDDRQAVDEHFAAYREDIADLPEAERFLAQAAYAGRAGMMPAPLVREIEGGLLAKDPEGLVNAAKRFAFMEKQLPKPCPEGVMYMVPCERARCLAKWAKFELPAAEIVERADAECPILPGYGPGEEGGFRALPFKPGEDDARVVLLAARAPAGRRAQDGAGDNEGGAPETIVGAGGNDSSSEAQEDGRLDEPVAGRGRPKERPGEQARSDAGHSLGDLTRDELFDVIRERLRPREGGVVNDSQGGKTNQGISQEFYSLVRDQAKYRDFPRQTTDLTDEQITQIYRNEYFDQPKLDRLMEVEGLLEESPQLFEQTFDAAVLHGADTSAQLLQAALDDVVGTDLVDTAGDSDADPSPTSGLKPTGARLEHYDGNIGPETRGAMEQAVERGLAAAVSDRMVELRIDYMKEQGNFTGNPGWIPRAKSFRTESYQIPATNGAD